MQRKHSEISKLTYTKNIQRCLQIHGEPEDEECNPVGLEHCILHNTDKVDRRFFGIYGSQRQNLDNKYAFP